MRGRPRPEPRAPFRPHRWEPLTEPLFDVVPPTDATSEVGKAWYGNLVAVTGMAVKHLVNRVDANYRYGHGVRFDGRVQGWLEALCEVISVVYLDSEISAEEVNAQLGRMVKTFGLITYDPEPGRRQWWPMATAVLSDGEAERLVRDAFHGNYPRRDNPTT